jgi:nicotinate-nucleotide--dimethylbenzimidazole phosphoribosyltransferase
MRLDEALSIIKPMNETAKKQCMSRWDSIAKPLHSLGKLEDGIAQIAAITATHHVCIDKKVLVIMCADNGVVAEGVTQVGSEITALVSENFIDMNSCVCIMAKQAGVDVYPIDVGIKVDTRVPKKKVSYGTKNILLEPAMTREQAIKIIEAGIDTVFELKEQGYQIIATGEMGIGNTTTSSAVAAVLLNVPVEAVTGRGAGLSNEGLSRKVEVIKKAIDRHQPVKEDPFDVLSKVGGYDIAGMVGLYIGGAAARLPIVMDGFISTVAALLATRIEPLVKHYLLPSHVSKEMAGKMILDALGVKPYLTCEMCLGEGTGAVSLFPLLDMGLAVYTQMSTFDQIEMDAYRPL